MVFTTKWINAKGKEVHPTSTLVKGTFLLYVAAGVDFELIEILGCEEVVLLWKWTIERVPQKDEVVYLQHIQNGRFLQLS